MGGREPGQARDRAAISGYSYVPGFSLKVVFLFLGASRFFATAVPLVFEETQ